MRFHQSKYMLLKLKETSKTKCKAQLLETSENSVENDRGELLQNNGLLSQMNGAIGSLRYSGVKLKLNEGEKLIDCLDSNPVS